MNALRFSFLLLIILLLPTVDAQAGAPLPVHFTVSASPAPAHPGEIVTITVKAQIDPGCMSTPLFPPRPARRATQIAALGAAAPLGPTTEDAPISKFDPNFQTQVAYHENTALFTRQFRIQSAAQVVTLHYQTCNAHVCLPPTDVSLPLTLSVVPGGRAGGPTPNPLPRGEGAR